MDRHWSSTTRKREGQGYGQGEGYGPGQGEAEGQHHCPVPPESRMGNDLNICIDRMRSVRLWNFVRVFFSCPQWMEEFKSKPRTHWPVDKRRRKSQPTTLNTAPTRWLLERMEGVFKEGYSKKTPNFFGWKKSRKDSGAGDTRKGHFGWGPKITQLENWAEKANKCPRTIPFRLTFFAIF